MDVIRHYYQNETKPVNQKYFLFNDMINGHRSGL